MFDPTKPVQTRNGFKARILCTDAKISSGESIIAAIDDGYGNEIIRTYFSSGKFLRCLEDTVDLINTPEKIYAGVYTVLTSAGWEFRITDTYKSLDKLESRLSILETDWYPDKFRKICIQESRR